jgi:hypothetical protein
VHDPAGHLIDDHGDAFSPPTFVTRHEVRILVAAQPPRRRRVEIEEEVTVHAISMRIGP